MQFDLETSIKEWLSDHSKTGSFEDGQLAEIEDHFRTKIEALQNRGMTDQQAFDMASAKWGQINSIANDERQANVNRKFYYPLGKQLIFVLRLFRKSPITTLLNIGGLTLGIASSIVILLFVLKEYSYDEMHSKKNRIYRVELDSSSPSGTTHFVTTGPPTGQYITSTYEEVENSVIIKRGDEVLVRFEDKAFYEDRLYYVEPSYFEIFDFQLKYGDSKTALSQPNSVVLTKEAATKYFGDSDPTGQVLQAGSQTLSVTGVFEQLPNTHFEMDLLVSFSSYEYPSFGSPTSWSWITFYNYILLKESSSKSDFEKKLPEIVKVHFPPERVSSIKLTLRGIKDIYLTPSETPSDEIGPTSNKLYSQVLTFVALLIMLVAGLNYINLSTAAASYRSKEVGIKKALGASKRSLMSQLLLESALTGIISAVLGLVLSYLAVINLGQSLGLFPTDFTNFTRPLLIFSILFGGLVGLLSGIYPGLLLAGVKTKKALLSNYSSLLGGRSLLRKILVGSQYTISISLIMVTLIILKQINYLTSKNLGFNKENVLVVPLNEPEQRHLYQTFETMLEQQPDITGVAAARLGLEGLHGSYQFVERGTNVGEAPRMSIYPVNLDFIDLLGIKHLDGRKFNQVSTQDTLHKFIMNESAVALMGWNHEQALGKRGMLTGQGGIHGEIVGVVSDFHFEPLQNEIEPLIMWFRENAAHYVYIKTSSGNIEAQIQSIEEVFTTVFPEYIFEYEFLDDRINENYHSDQAFAKALSIFSTLAILISCVGLFGMTIFLIQRKMKEIGIRKVLGARVHQVVMMLNKEFLMLIGLTSLISLPIGYIGGSQWVENFAYRTEYGVEIFALSLLSVTIITILTISYHTLKAALTNPSKVIRYE